MARRNPPLLPRTWQSLGKDLNGHPVWLRSPSARRPSLLSNRYLVVYKGKHFHLWWDPGVAESKWKGRTSPRPEEHLGAFTSIPALETAVKTDMAFRPFGGAHDNPMTPKEERAYIADVAAELRLPLDTTKNKPHKRLAKEAARQRVSRAEIEEASEVPLRRRRLEAIRRQGPKLSPGLSAFALRASTRARQAESAGRRAREDARRAREDARRADKTRRALWEDSDAGRDARLRAPIDASGAHVDITGNRFYRMIDHLREAGWIELPPWDFGERSNWKCLREPCDKRMVSEFAAQVQAWAQHYEGEKTLFVKYPENWFNTARYATTVPESIYPWILIANRVDFRLGARWNQDPKKVQKWLEGRRPSRKALEKKLDKYLSTLPTDKDWSDRHVMPWIEHLGGWHVRNDNELRILGVRNGWCFGAGYHSNYAHDINRPDSDWNDARSLYFIPSPKGLIALYTERPSPFRMEIKGEPEWVEAMYPNNEWAADDLKKMRSVALVEMIKKRAPDWMEEEQEWMEGGRRKGTGRRRAKRGDRTPRKGGGKATRRSARRNPLLKPMKTFGIVYKAADRDWKRKGRKWQDGPTLQLAVVDLTDPRAPVLVAGGVIRGKDKHVTDTMVAARGYGPLLYDAAATLSQLPLVGSGSQSKAAKRFWSRQSGAIHPLNPAEWKKKYGISLPELVKRGRVVDASKLFSGLMDEVDRLAGDARPAEWEGKTVQTPWEARQGARANPLLRPTKTFGIAYEWWGEDGYPLQLAIADLTDPHYPLLVAGGWINVAPDGIEYETSMMVASRGYGPLLYDAAATLLRSPIQPSGNRSQAALRFWARQGAEVHPLSAADWQKKYGISLAELLRKGKKITQLDLETLIEETQSLASEARMGEAFGMPVRTSWEDEMALRKPQAQRAQVRQNPPKIKGLLPPFPEKYRGLDIYDPREESIRAVVRGSGKWGVGIGHYAKKHSAEEIIQRSWERYQQPDQLIRNRQEYELGLGEMRQSGPYRTTLEPTTSGLRYFVWPLAARQRVPKPFRSKREAEAEKARRYQHGFRPRTDLGRKSYTKTELSGWLPPTSIFAGRSKRFSTAGKKELLPVPSRRQIPRKGKSLAAKYREYDPNWKSRPRLVARYKRKREPPKR